MIPTTSFQPGTSSRFVSPPKSPSAQPDILPPLPSLETVSTLQSLAAKKRKAINQDPESGATIVKQPGQIRPEIDPKTRIADILRSSAVLDPNQMGEMVRNLVISLGGQSMPADLCNQLMTQIVAAHDSCSETQLRAMVYALARALGGASITADILRALSTPLFQAQDIEYKKMLEMLEGLIRSLGGMIMSAQHRDALMAHLLDTLPSVNFLKLGHLIALIGKCLGGDSMTTENRRALMTPILGAADRCDHLKMGRMVLGMCDALGGPAITVAHRDALLAQILAAHAGCNPKQMELMIWGMTTAMGRASLSKENAKALSTQILAAHTSCSAVKIEKMICMMRKHMPVSDVFDGVLEAGGSPVTTGKMLGASIAGLHAAGMNYAQCQTEIVRLITENDTARLRRPYIGAGFCAAVSNISRILQMEEMSDDEKLIFVTYSCSYLKPMDETTLASKLGSVITLDLPNFLKADALTILISHGTGNPNCFTMVRQWLMGTLGELPEISPGDAESTVIDRDTQPLNAWRHVIIMLYHGFKKHMTADFVAKEKTIISRHPLLPSEIKGKILGLLTVDGSGLD